MFTVDLHVHTTASDGSKTTDEIIDMAKESGLRAIAVTDHDTISGIPGTSPDGIELVPGIEFSTKYKSKVHILGYFIDPDNSELKEQLDKIVSDRDIRNEKIVDLLRNDGIAVTYDEMKERFGVIVGKPHFAQILVENGLVSSISEAFSKYLDRDKKYGIRRTTVPLDKCISLITKAGGTPVIAHPFEYRYDLNSIDELICECMNLGAKGMECRHSSHTPGQMAYLEHLCDDYGLLKTGGSDFHGEPKPNIRLGCGSGLVSVPYSWFEELKKARGNN